MPGECLSGFCVDSVCCDTECAGTCQACSAAKKGSGVDGTCGNATATIPCGAVTCAAGETSTPKCDGAGMCATSKTSCGLFACDTAACKTTCAADGDCATTAWCDGTSCVAKKSNGDIATDKRACTSGFLADGVCCSAACDGVCEACDLEGTKGACAPVLGAARHGTCPTGTDVCANATCDGIDRTACKKFPGAEKECRTSTCVENIETLSARCDGMGACSAVMTKPCGEYVCDGNRCRTTCRSNPDCATGFTCDDVETKKCLPADTCDGDHTIKSRNGADKDCSPYKCSKSDCLGACLSTSQCTTGFVCNGKECVRSLETPPAADDDGGCAFVGAPGRGFAATFVAMIVALAALGRRQRPTCASRGSPRRSARTSPTR